MADENDAFRAGFDAFNEEGNYCNPYLSYHKHNAFIHGWNEARRTKRREHKAIHQLSTAPKAGASAGEATAPLHRVMPHFQYFVISRDHPYAVFAGFTSAWDAHIYNDAANKGWGELAEGFVVVNNDGMRVDNTGDIV